MLVNLFKYENKNYVKKFVPLLVFFFLLSCVATLFNAIPNPNYSNNMLDILQTLFEMAVYIGIFIYVIITAILCGQRFTNHLFGDEGYLTLTLPVPIWMHILVKSATATIWSLFGGFIVYLSASIFSNESFHLIKFTKELYEDLSYNSRAVNIPSFFYFLTIVLQIFIMGMTVYLLLYLGLTLSQSFAKGRLIATVVFLIAILFVFSYAIQFYSYLIWDVAWDLFSNSSSSKNPAAISHIIEMFAFPLYYGTIGVAAFFGINRLLKRRIDLI